MTASLYEIALGPDKSQRPVVDAITCEAPILRDLPMEPSSHGLWNIYESMKDVTGGDLVDLDAPLPKDSAESEHNQTDLSIIGGEMEVLHIINGLLQTGSNGISRHIALLAIKNIKAGTIVFHTEPQISIHHGQLIQIS